MSQFNDKALELYQRAINQIDDYFEYRMISVVDQRKVREILLSLTNGLAELSPDDKPDAFMYLVCRRPEKSEWEVQGLYHNSSDAAAACKNHTYSVMTCKTGVDYGEDTVASGYYPTVEAEIQRRVAAVIGGKS